MEYKSNVLAQASPNSCATNSMPNAFQRLSYDSAAYETDLKQSTRPLLYSLDPLYANPCKICRPGDVGYIGRVGTSIDKNYGLIDAESELRLLNYKASKAPQFQFNPLKSADGKPMKLNTCRTGYPGPEAGGIQFELLDQDRCVDPSDKWHFPTCPKLSTEYTRVTYPTCDMRCTGVNRFQPLCLDPQDRSRWEHPSEIGISYRNVVKDNHQPCIPRPMDQNAALPLPSTNKGIPAKKYDGVSGLPQKRVTLTYCTVATDNFRHKFYCDKAWEL